MSKLLKISVDQGKCIGSKTCIYYASQTFALDQDGKSTVVNAEGNHWETIQEAADGCPVGAITIEEVEA